jgi:DNA-binding NarL/FixJ family response regulator
MSVSEKVQSRCMKRRVLIVDDHPIVRRGLRSLLGDEPGVVVCGEAEDVEDAMEMIKTTHPELVIVDISLKTGSGLRLLAEMKARFPGVKTLVWSMFDEELYAERALRAGALGYINKRESIDHVVDAVSRVLDGEVYLSEPMTRCLLQRVSGGADLDADPVGRLSNRELEVFELIGRGHTTQEIARSLHLSPKTVEAHRERIKLKLDLRNAAELNQRAVQWCLQK